MQTYEIRWGWADRLKIMSLAVLAFAALMVTLSACGPNEDTNVPQPVANVAPVAPAKPSATHSTAHKAKPVHKPTVLDNSDCHALKGDTASLCQMVSSLPAYGWTNPDGSRTDNPNGKTNVRDLLSSTTDPEEIKAGLTAMLADYRAHTKTMVVLDLGRLPSADCWYEVGYADQHVGQAYTLRAQVEPVCPGSGEPHTEGDTNPPRYLQAND